jgi:uracil-DNA glycosylase
MSSNKKFVNIAQVLDGVHPTFKKLLLGDEMKPYFAKAMTIIDPDDVVPDPRDIFHFAKYAGLDDVKVVIIGQCPNESGDHGLCFSSLNKNVQEPLKNVYLCLEESKLIESVDSINTSDLRSWAQQGVLMLNMSLTRCGKGTSSKHNDAWKPITTHIVKTLGAVDRPIVFMLWGVFAKTLKKFITSDKAVVLEEHHPAPIFQNNLSYDKKFAKCGHFAKTNSVLESAGYDSICWDPNFIQKHLVFTDGSGLNTGNCNSKGSYATLFVRGSSKGTMLYGRIPPVFLLDLDDLKGDSKWSPETNPCWIDDDRAYTIGRKHSKTKTWTTPLATVYIKSVENETVFPTSQRGEGMAILIAFEHVIRADAKCSIEIVTDSMFWINMINSYIPRWVKQNRPFYIQKNPDIVSRMWKAMCMMKEAGFQYSMRHIKSHGKDPNANPFDVAMNDIVDVKALAARNSNEFGDFKCVRMI